MKLSLFLFVCLVALLGWPVKSFSQANLFDIVLEGPWILYEDDSAFANYPVLVAIAPVQGMDQPDAMHFHFLQVSNGDGYYINRTGLYCLMFGTSSGSQCAPSWTGSFAPGVGYPNTAGLLPLNFTHSSTGTAWGWASLISGKTVLILPMPKSYSTTSAWSMRFSDHFDNTGASYKSANGDSHSTGIALHYATKDAVTYFDLNVCDPANPDSGHCTTQASFPNHTNLPNLGTLSLLMKSPEVADGCDIHVRTTYPSMTALLDKAANSKLAYIEPAIDINSAGQPVFEGGASGHACLDKDPQQYAYVPTSAPGAMEPMHGGINVAANLLDGLVKLIDQSEIIKPDDKATLLPVELRNASKDLDRDRNFPRISELDLIAALSQISADKSETLASDLTVQMQGERSANAQSGTPSISVSAVELNNYTQLLASYHAIQALAHEIALTIPAKGAKDCLAPIVQAVY
jgi:hypothetical protein